MARHVAHKDVTAAPVEAGTETRKGVWFIKNNINELVLLPGGKGDKTYKFTRCRECFFDPEMIEGIRSVADRHHIIEETE